MNASARPSSKGRILVVDDDRLVLATLCHGLTEAGYEVIDADNGDDAILLAREQRPELALLDIRMGGKSGFEVAAYLRAYAPIPFIFLSAFADPATQAQAQALGAAAYLVKPLEVGEIVPKIAAALGERLTPPRDRPAARAAAPADEKPAAALLVAMAVGLLMGRHALARGPAVARLHQLAEACGRSVVAHAEALLAECEPPLPSGRS